MNNTGWICPLCGVANAPWKEKCDCVNGVVSVPYVQPLEWTPYPHPYEQAPWRLPQTWCSNDVGESYEEKHFDGSQWDEFGC